MAKVASNISERKRVQKVFTKPSRAVQYEKDNCDINLILAKYRKTGLIEHLNRFQGQYGDFSNIQDYQTSLNQVISAQEMFNSLPSFVRARFANDPASFLNFVTDPSNKDELVKMGLAKASEDQNLDIEKPEKKSSAGADSKGEALQKS